jgi:hypothetical protein
MSTAAENQPSIYSSWLNYVSQAHFLPDQNYIVSREYMNIKQWDLRTAKAVHSTEISDAQTQNIQHLQR